MQHNCWRVQSQMMETHSLLLHTYVIIAVYVWPWENQSYTHIKVDLHNYETLKCNNFLSLLNIVTTISSYTQHSEIQIMHMYMYQIWSRSMHIMWISYSCINTTDFLKPTNTYSIVTHTKSVYYICKPCSEGATI